MIFSHIKLLKFDARTLYFERALYFAKLDLVSTEVFVRVLAHFVKLYASSVLVNSLRDGYGEGFSLVPNDIFVRK